MRPGVTVSSMKKLFAFLIIIGAGIGGFFWWKQNQVIAANEVAADPWPAAVATVEAPKVETSVEAVPPAVKPVAKKATPRKSTAKQAAQKSAESNNSQTD